MKHPISKALRPLSTVQIDDEARQLFLRKKAAAEGKVYVPQPEAEARPVRTTVEYCSETLSRPDIQTCNRARRSLQMEGAGLCDQYCLVWMFRR